MNNDVSCSSVHGSASTWLCAVSKAIGILGRSAGFSIASPDGADAALEERRGFFLGGILRARATNTVRFDGTQAYLEARAFRGLRNSSLFRFLSLGLSGAVVAVSWRRCGGCAGHVTVCSIGPGQRNFEFYIRRMVWKSKDSQGLVNARATDWIDGYTVKPNL